jgi:glyoxylase-like metal-dependent hydrolase (beta-lactamase superfamily II)
LGKDTAVMFPLQSGQNKHRSALLMGVCALLCGCGTSWFLHVSPRSFDDRLKLLLGGGGNVAVLLHGRGEALVVDTKFGNFSRRLRSEVEVELSRKVRRIVLTHAHFDHAVGLKLFPDAAVVMVHPNARKRLEAEGIRAPFVEVEREVRLVLEGEEVRVLGMGSGHTDGDLVALLPGRKLLIVGDLMNEGFEPYCDPKYGGDILALSRTLPNLMTLDFEQVVPGHGEVMPRAVAQSLADYVAALQAEVRKARAEGLTEDQVVDKVKLPEYPLKNFLMGVSTRSGNVRAMFHALEREGKTAP